MRTNCLKGGGGVISLNHPELTFRSQFSISGYKWLQIWRFQPTTLQQNTISFIQTAKKWKGKKWLLLKNDRACMLCCSHQAERRAAVEGARSRAPLWKALINPDLSGALTRGGAARQQRRLETRRGVAARFLKCCVWLSLPIRWQLNFNINMIILK